MEQIEGRICVEAALKARQRKISLLLIRDSLHQQLVETILNEADQQNIPIKYISRHKLDTMAHGKTHGGIIAIATPKPPISWEILFEQIKNQTSKTALLLLEGIDDSQNLGFTLRSAEAMGITAVLLKKHLWDFNGTAVSRSSSGAYERLSVALLDRVDKILPRFKNLGLTIYGCIANAKRTMYEADLTGSLMLAIGGEKRGLSAAVRQCCDVFIKIPMATNIGSLSLSHSASIVMAEMMRQRLFVGRSK